MIDVLTASRYHWINDNSLYYAQPMVKYEEISPAENQKIDNNK